MKNWLAFRDKQKQLPANQSIADTIVENCGTSLILRCSASEQGGTSQFASRLIGQREVVHLSQSKTWQPDKWFPSRTTSEQRSIEPAVMASEIERLADLEGFLKFASIPDWQYVALTHVQYPTIDRPKRAGGAAPRPEPAPVAPMSSADKPTAAASGPVESKDAVGEGARKSRTRKAQSGDAQPGEGKESGDSAESEPGDVADRKNAGKLR